MKTAKTVAQAVAVLVLVQQVQQVTVAQAHHRKVMQVVKVTAVQVSPSNGPSEWQEEYAAQAALSRRILAAEGQPASI